MDTIPQKKKKMFILFLNNKFVIVLSSLACINSCRVLVENSTGIRTRIGCESSTFLLFFFFFPFAQETFCCLFKVINIQLACNGQTLDINIYGKVTFLV